MKKIIFILLVLIPFSANATTTIFRINLPDAKLPAITNSFATQYGYQETLYDENGDSYPNPVTKRRFMKNIIRAFIMEVHVGAQLKDLETTRLQIIEDANTDTDAITVE